MAEKCPDCGLLVGYEEQNCQAGLRRDGDARCDSMTISLLRAQLTAALAVVEAGDKLARELKIESGSVLQVFDTEENRAKAARLDDLVHERDSARQALRELTK